MYDSSDTIQVPLSEHGIRLGPAAPAARNRMLAAVLVAFLVGAPMLILMQAPRQILQFGGNVTLGPKFRGRVLLPSGNTLEVSDAGASTELQLLQPAPPGRRYRWLVEARLSYPQLAGEYRGGVDYRDVSGKRLMQVSRLWLGFVRVEL